jgi:hypothetical protein
MFSRPKQSLASPQPIADLFEPRSRAGIVELGPWRTGCSNGANDLVVELDHHSSAKEHDMRQLGERCNRVLAFGTLGKSKRVVFEGYTRLRLVMRAIECVYAGAIAAQ